MKNHWKSDTATEAEIEKLERKLKEMGAIIGTGQNLPRKIHLAFLKRVYAFEMKENTADINPRY